MRRTEYDDEEEVEKEEEDEALSRAPVRSELRAGWRVRARLRGGRARAPVGERKTNRGRERERWSESERI